MVLAVAHPNPWASASFYLPSQSLSGALSYSKTKFACMNLTKREAIPPTQHTKPLPTSRASSRHRVPREFNTVWLEEETQLNNPVRAEGPVNC